MNIIRQAHSPFGAGASTILIFQEGGEDMHYVQQLGGWLHETTREDLQVKIQVSYLFGRLRVSEAKKLAPSWP